MDTKRIVWDSISRVVERIGTEKELQKIGQEKPGQAEKSNFYDPEPLDESSILEQIETEKDDDKKNLNEIEIKSGELIVLESERKKEKEFLEKVRESIDLCYGFAGSKNKCKNELRKVKRMIDDYIFSIES